MGNVFCSLRKGSRYVSPRFSGDKFSGVDRVCRVLFVCLFPCGTFCKRVSYGRLTVYLVVFSPDPSPLCTCLLLWMYFPHVRRLRLTLYMMLGAQSRVMLPLSRRFVGMLGSTVIRLRPCMAWVRPPHMPWRPPLTLCMCLMWLARPFRTPLPPPARPLMFSPPPAPAAQVVFFICVSAELFLSRRTTDRAAHLSHE